jgi:hypothetical protein
MKIIATEDTEFSEKSKPQIEQIVVLCDFVALCDKKYE